MARLQIEMDLENADFAEFGRDEAIAAILQRLADRIKANGAGTYPLTDFNGNRIGECKLA